MQEYLAEISKGRSLILLHRVSVPQEIVNNFVNAIKATGRTVSSQNVYRQTRDLNDDYN